MAKLGCQVLAVGAIGDDEVGHILVGILNRYHINTASLARKAGFKTSSTILPIRPNGERPALHMIGANAAFSFKDVPIDAIAQHAPCFVHIGGFYLMERFDGVDTVRTLQAAKAAGHTTTMDVIGFKQDNMLDKILPCMPYLDYFMPNLEEAELITGLSNSSSKEAIVDMARVFLNAGARAVIFKMGSRGSFLMRSDGTRFRIPAFEVNVVDTTGCGDAWTAGFIAALSRGMDEEASARFGSACGSLVATGLGSDHGIVDFGHTMEFMRTTSTLPLGDAL
jgi:sugar/nucleoside kinase (ribokinase family)